MIVCTVPPQPQTRTRLTRKPQPQPRRLLAISGVPLNLKPRAHAHIHHTPRTTGSAMLHTTARAASIHLLSACHPTVSALKHVHDQNTLSTMITPMCSLPHDPRQHLSYPVSCQRHSAIPAPGPWRAVPPGVLFLAGARVRAPWRAVPGRRACTRARRCRQLFTNVHSSSSLCTPRTASFASCTLRTS